MNKNEIKVIIYFKVVGYLKNVTHKDDRGNILHTKEEKLVDMVTKITQESYDHMTSMEGNTPQSKIKKGQWQMLGKAVRFQKHIELMAKDYGAVKFSFEFVD